MRLSYLCVWGEVIIRCETVANLIQYYDIVVNMQYETISRVLLHEAKKLTPKKESLMTITACDCTCTIATNRYVFLCILFLGRIEKHLNPPFIHLYLDLACSIRIPFSLFSNHLFSQIHLFSMFRSFWCCCPVILMQLYFRLQSGHIPASHHILNCIRPNGHRHWTHTIFLHKSNVYFSVHISQCTSFHSFALASQRFCIHFYFYIKH